jgi:hypothetical protein
MVLSKVKKTIALLNVILSLCVTSILAQEINIGADIVSRYVWRGVDFGNAPAVQPFFELSMGNFSLGSWGSYSIGKTDSGSGGLNEHDLYISYNLGIFTIGVSDYYYPGVGGFFTFDTDYNHVIEPYISYTGLIKASLYINAINDPDNSMYLELGYDLMVKEVEVSLFAGTALLESDWYGVDDTALINIGLTATKNHLAVSYLVNPYAEESFLVFCYSF